MIECAEACEDKYSMENSTATAATCDRQLNCWCSIVSINSTVFQAIDTLQPLRQSGNKLHVYPISHCNDGVCSINPTNL